MDAKREYLHRPARRVLFLDNPPENCPPGGPSQRDTLGAVGDASDEPLEDAYRKPWYRHCSLWETMGDVQESLMHAQHT